MALAALRPILGKRRGAIDIIIVDAIIDEAHNRSSNITVHPIQNSSPIADHIINEPETVTMRCQISDTPIRTSFLQNLSRIATFLKPSQQAFEYLNSLWRQKVRMTVVSSLKVYRGMAIRNIEFNRGFRTSNILDFTITLQKINVFCEPSIFNQVPQLQQLTNSLKNLREPFNAGRRNAFAATAEAENAAVNLLRGLP